MSKSDIQIQKSGDALKVTVSGIIDEDVDFTQYSVAGTPQLDVHLDQLKSINSCGIREWIKWLGNAAQAKVVYHQCPKVIVDQINMVQGFLPSNGKVQSFYVPYFNEDSGEEKSVLFTAGKEFTDTTVTPPAEVKDSSGSPMEMDVIESKYFKFIKK